MARMRLRPVLGLAILAQLGLLGGMGASWMSPALMAKALPFPGITAADEVACPDSARDLTPLLPGNLPSVTTVAVAPSADTPTIYAGTWGHGVYQSLDRGLTWTAVDGGPAQVTSIAVYPNDPASLIVGTANLGVLRLENGGGTCGYLSAGLPALNVTSVGVNPSPFTTLFAGTPQGLYWSLDNGASWTLFGLANDQVSSIAFDRSGGDILYAGTEGNGILVTRDGGASWETLRSPGVPIDALFLDPAGGRVLYGGTRGGGVVRIGLFKTARIDGRAKGDSPIMAPQVDSSMLHPGTAGDPPPSGPFGGTAIDLKMDPLTPTTLYAASYVGLFKTIDNGETWQPTGLMSRTILSIAIDPVNPQNVYAGSKGQGLFRSNDGGATWTMSDDEWMRGKVIYTVAVDPLDPRVVYAGGRALHTDGTASGDWGGGLFKSNDGGATWRKLDNGLPEGWVYAVVIDPTTPSTLYAGTHSMGVFKSVDGGAIWEAMNSGLVTADHPLPDNLKIRSLAINPQDPQNLVVGVWGGSGVLETDTGAESWHVAGAPGLSARVRTVAFNPSVAGLVYAGKVSGGIFYLGADIEDPSWKSFPDQSGGGWGDFSITSAIAVNPVDGNTLFIGEYGIGILRSTDGGNTWKPVNYGFAATSVTAVVSAPSQPGSLFASTNGSGIFRSTDGGTNWSLQSWPGPWDWTSGIALDPSNPSILYVATQDGVNSLYLGGE